MSRAFESRAARVGRWIVPGAGLTMAAAGVVFLAAQEVLGDPEPGAPPRAPVALTTQAAGQAPRPRATPAPAPRPAPPSRHAPAGVPAVAIEPRPVLRETAASLRATPHLVRLAQAPGLLERIAIVDELATTLPVDAAAAAFEGLLDSELPGDFYEAESLRLAVLARLGALPGPGPCATLTRRLDAERPRPERLLAVELLAVRPDAALGHGQLASLAAHDHDEVVQERAQWALKRAGAVR